MSLLHPEFLYYLLPPLIILFILLLTQKSSEAAFFSEEVMAKLRVNANRLTLQARNGLFFIIGLLIILALSGPVIDEGTVEVKAKSVDLMLALDISDSMLAEDVYPNRLKLAKQKALDLLKLTPNERVGVIGFAKNSYLVSPLSFDANAVAFLLRALNTDSITEKGTDFLTMLEVVNKSIKGEEAKYLLILSDGGDAEDFSQEIAYAKEHNIIIFVLGIGTKKGAPIKREDGSFIKQNGHIIISKLNENITTLATSTGGVYIKSLNAQKDIRAMLQEIHSHAKQKELKAQKIKRFIPLFYYPLGVALLLLLIATSSMSSRKEVTLPALFLLGALLLHPQDAAADLFDFVKLKEAKEAYTKGEYEKANTLYNEYADSSDNAQTHYNIANTLYKQGHYNKAIQSYKKAFFKNNNARAMNYANLGNAYVKSQQKESLQKAIKAYETSLEMQEDKDVRENLEAVKEALKKQQQQQQQKQQQQKNDKNKKEKENKQQNKNQKNKEQKNKEQEQKKQSEKEKSDKNRHNKKEQQKQKKQKEETKKEQEEKSQKEKAKLDKDMQNKMSEAEEKKWLKQLNKQQSTFLYRLNKKNNHKENSNEKPW